MAKATTPKQLSDRRAADLLQRLTVSEQRVRAQRIAKIKRAICACVFRDDEIWNIEQIVFLAYGRAKL